MALMDRMMGRLIPGKAEEGRLISNGRGFGIGPVSANSVAYDVVDAHRRAKSRRRLRDLTAEKYLIHIDGEGSAQWADIVDSNYVMIPPTLIDSLRLQRNLLRPMVDNMVAYHTAMEFRCAVQSAQDKKSRDRARIDEAYGNWLIRQQRLNEVFAEALYMGAPYGHCPVHAQWRDDLTVDLYEPIYNQSAELSPEMLEAMVPGFVDVWVGDPWATVYNEGATRRNVQAFSYDRVLPAELLRQAFAHVPGIEKLEGRKDLPSASRFQRTIRRWTSGYYGQGTAAILGGTSGEELSAIVCKEVAPGIDPDHPAGRLLVVAINGASDADTRHGTAGQLGNLLLLHDGPLPARRFSAVRVYAGQRSDDVLGAPYVKDLDDLQVQLNHLVTLRQEFLVRFARPQFAAASDSIVDDSAVTADDGIIEFSGQIPPQFLYPPVAAVSFFDSAIAETLDQLFRIGGWQAASRGESGAGDPAAKVVALARADDTIFGPINRAFQGSVVELLQTAHALAKRYMTVPLLLEIAGEEFGYLAEPWIRAEQLSDRPPHYRLVNGFGATPESRAQQLIQLVGTRGADGVPLLSTQQFWTLWPDHSLRPPETDATRLRETRAQAVNYAIEEVADAMRQQFGPQAEALAVYAHQAVGQEHPLERSDDPMMHVEALDQIVQNVHADPLARQLARWRQDLYYDWLNQMAAAGAVQPTQQPVGGSTAAPTASPARRSGTSPVGGTTTSESMGPSSLEPTVRALTNQARTGG